MITVYPVDAVAGAPLYSARMVREALSVFSAGASPSRPFGCVSGVRPGTSTTTVTATGTTWTIGAHAGILDLQGAAEAGGYPYAINAVGGLPTGAVTAANATNPRVDIVWLRIDDPAESDGSAVPAVVAGYTAGVAASTPAPPATPARCMVLAWINVPASGGGSPTATWKAPYLGSAGGIADGNIEKVRTLAPALAGALFMTTLDLVADQTITAGQFSTAKYVLRVSTSIQSLISASGGVRLEILVDGAVVKSATFGNGGSGAQNTAVAVNWEGALTSAAAHTTRARIVPVVTGSTVIADTGQTFAMSIAPAADF